MRGDESKDPYFKELFALRLSLFAKTATLRANAGSGVVPEGTRPIQRLFTQHSRAGLDYCLRFAESQCRKDSSMRCANTAGQFKVPVAAECYFTQNIVL